MLVGVGVSNADQAREACSVADGVVQGASVVRRLMEDGPDAVGDYVAEVRAAIDTLPTSTRGFTDRYVGPISTAELVAGTATTPESIRADDDPGAVGGLATRRRVPVAIVGLVGIVIAFVGITGMFAFQQAPFYDADEKAHLGYAHEIADFRLPEIERQPDGPGERHAVAGRARHRPGQPLPRRVGGQPPTAALRRRRPADLVRRGDRSSDGGLLLMRFANIAFAAAGVVFTYLLATELTGGTPGRSRCRGDRRPRPPGPHLLLARPQRWAGVRRRHRVAVGGAALPAPTRPPQSRRPRRDGGRRRRHADGDDAARASSSSVRSPSFS